MKKKSKKSPSKLYRVITDKNCPSECSVYFIYANSKIQLWPKILQREFEEGFILEQINGDMIAGSDEICRFYRDKIGGLIDCSTMGRREDLQHMSDEEYDKYAEMCFHKNLDNYFGDCLDYRDVFLQKRREFSAGASKLSSHAEWVDYVETWNKSLILPFEMYFYIFLREIENGWTSYGIEVVKDKGVLDQKK